MREAGPLLGLGIDKPPPHPMATYRIGSRLRIEEGRGPVRREGSRRAQDFLPRISRGVSRQKHGVIGGSGRVLRSYLNGQVGHGACGQPKTLLPRPDATWSRDSARWKILPPALGLPSSNRQWGGGSNGSW